MYKSQFQKTDPYDWFSGPGSHMCEWLLTQHSEADDADIAPPAVGQVVDQALVCPRVRQLRVIDEDRGTCAGHGGDEAHAPVHVIG